MSSSIIVHKLSIGKVLSIIQDAQIKEKSFLENYPESINYYNSLKARFNKFENDPNLTNSIFNSIPKQCCQANKSFLKDNDDFFIAYTVLSKKEDIHINNAKQFIHHLNNCYWCFIEYNQFINDEYFTNKGLETGVI